MGSVNTYTYIFVREDLEPVTRIVQASHAAFEMGRDLNRPQSPTIDNLIVLKVNGEKDLLTKGRYLEYNDVKHHAFYEPDYNLGYTAICTEPISEERKHLFSRFRLLK